MSRGNWTYETLTVGEKDSFTELVTGTNIDVFAALSHDHNKVHLDEEYAKTTMFKGRIAHGFYTAGFITAIVGSQLPGPGTIYLSQSFNFKAPVRLGDTVTAWVEIAEKLPKYRVRLKTWVENQDGKVVLDGEGLVIFH